MSEVWRDIKGYKGRYQISSFGRVKSLGRYHSLWHKWVNKIIFLKPNLVKGYYRVSLSKNSCKKKRMIHFLVAQAFIPNPLNKPQVNHKDGNKQNNYADNLEWVTAKENIRHSWDVLDSSKRRKAISLRNKLKVGKLNPAYKGRVICLNSGKVFESANEITKILGLSRSALCGVLNKSYGFKTVKGLRFEYYMEV
jgi:hypothetical protein